MLLVTAILKINGDALLQTSDDGAFMNVLKAYFNSLHEPLYPESDNPKARTLTVSPHQQTTSSPDIFRH